MSKKYIFHSDSGHGWVAVKTSELERLGIIHDITGYSYISKSGKTVYLEKYRDATLFIKTKEALNETVEFIDKYVDGHNGNIRNLEEFSVLTATKKVLSLKNECHSGDS